MERREAGLLSVVFRIERDCVTSLLVSSSLEVSKTDSKYGTTPLANKTSFPSLLQLLKIKQME